MRGGKQGCVGETGLCGEVSKIVQGNGAVRGGRQGCAGRRAGNNHLLSVGLDMNCC